MKLFSIFIFLTSFAANAQFTQESVRQKFINAPSQVKCEAWQNKGLMGSRLDELIGNIEISVDFQDVQNPKVTTRSKTEELSFSFGQGVCAGRINASLYTPMYLYDYDQGKNFLVYQCMEDSSWIFSIHNRLTFDEISNSYVTICKKAGASYQYGCFELRNCK